MYKIGPKLLWRMLVGAALCCGAAVPGFTQISVAEFAAHVDDHYNHMHTLRAQFAEEYEGAGLTRSEKGTLILKKPGKMRWEYTSPRPKLFITDGKNAYFYVPGEQQVRKTEVKNLDDVRSPLRYLLGKTKLEKELADLSFAAEEAPVAAGDRILRGVPKSMSDQISEILLEVTPQYEIVRLVMHENDGSKTEFRFEKLEENVEAGDYLFDFSPPHGVEILEGNSLTP